MYGNPEAIRRLATQLRERAADLNSDANRLVGAAEGTAWVSAAGARMTTRARERGGQLRETANDYIDAADKLEHHAHEIERLIELIASIEKLVSGLIAAAASRVASAGKAIADGVVDIFTDDDKADQRLANTSTPPSGDKGWLNFGDMTPGGN